MDQPEQSPGIAKLRPRAYEFGHFRVEVAARKLLRGRDEIELKRKTFELLVALLERAREVIPKDDLLHALWPDTVVEEANLTQNIYLLRKALGENAERQNYIETVPKSGYRLNADVVEFWDTPPQTIQREAKPATVSESHANHVSPHATMDGNVLRRHHAPLVIVFVAILSTSMLAALYAFVYESPARLLTSRAGAGPEKKEATDGRQTHVRAAHEAFIRGEHHWSLRTEPATELAISYFEEAVRLDPNYALAHAMLADSYAIVGFFRYGLLPRDEAYRRAAAVARRALELNPTLAETHLTLALIKDDYEGDAAAAETAIKQAIHLNPNHAMAHHRYSMILSRQGRFSEAYDEAFEARRLDPLSRAVTANLIVLLIQMRDYAKVAEYCRQAREIQPESPYLYVYCGIPLEQEGKIDEALSGYKKALALATEGTAPHDLALQFYAMGCASTGRASDARQIARELALRAEQTEENLLGVAGIYARLGERKLALVFLDRYLRRSPENRRNIHGDPRVAKMEGDPEYLALLKKYPDGSGK